MWLKQGLAITLYFMSTRELMEEQGRTDRGTKSHRGLLTFRVYSHEDDCVIEACHIDLVVCCISDTNVKVICSSCHFLLVLHFCYLHFSLLCLMKSFP